MAWKYKGDKCQNDPMGFNFVWFLSFVSLIQKALGKKKKKERMSGKKSLKYVIPLRIFFSFGFTCSMVRNGIHLKNKTNIVLSPNGYFL